jgi:hypothetical protein
MEREEFLYILVKVYSSHSHYETAENTVEEEGRERKVNLNNSSV